METREYATMAAFEKGFWWYQGQRDMILDQLRKLYRPGDRVLDAGCGTGAFADRVRETLDADVSGVDLSPHAAEFWSEPLRASGTLASIDRLPFGSRSFEIVYSIDVLCCREVDATAAVREFVRVLKPGGRLLLVVPAYQWLLSEHDCAVHATRRFNRRDLQQLAADGELAVERIQHCFGLLFPGIAAIRLMRKRPDYRKARDGARSDLRPIPRWLNGTLFGVTRVERMLARHAPLPWGTTLMMTTRKESLMSDAADSA